MIVDLNAHSPEFGNHPLDLMVFGIGSQRAEIFEGKARGLDQVIDRPGDRVGDSDRCFVVRAELIDEAFMPGLVKGALGFDGGIGRLDEGFS
jgi:hypothetical protein